MAAHCLYGLDLQHRRSSTQSRLSLYRLRWLDALPGLRPQSCPGRCKPPLLSNAIDFDDQSASIELAFSVAEYFELKIHEAREAAAEVAGVVSGWRTEAARAGLTRGDCERMASAFEHDDLRKALA